MSAQSDVTPTAAPPHPAALTNVYQEGIVAGLIGAATVAIWFLIVDVARGRPFYTPNVLGTALFRRGESVASLEAAPLSLELILMFTWVHALVFAAIGGVAAWLLSQAERNANVGFGIVILFVVFEAGFIAAAMIFSQPLLQALAWPAVLVANLLAAAAMAEYFRRRHPSLAIAP